MKTRYRAPAFLPLGTGRQLRGKYDRRPTMMAGE
jgi:hypothetical protein